VKNKYQYHSNWLEQNPTLQNFRAVLKNAVNKGLPVLGWQGKDWRCSIAESGSYASSVAATWRRSDVSTSDARTHDATDGSGR